MGNNPSYFKKYYDEVISMMHNFPNDEKYFKDLWEERKYRELYLYVYEFMTRNNIVSSPEFEKISEDFYGDYVN